MDHSLTVSVLVPTFNRDMFIAETLDSVVAQLRPGDEIIVIDDGSIDGTPALISSGSWPICYLRQDNAGKSVAINRGLAAAKGDLIWIVDDDDVMSSGALEKMRCPLEADESVGFTFGHYDYLVQEGRAWATKRTPVFVHPDEPLHLSLLRRCFIHQPGTLVRRRCYDAVGPFDTALRRSQDYDMILRISRAFYGVEVQGPLFQQRQHEGQRGAGETAVAARHRARAWLKYDALIFQRIYADYPFDEFREMVRPRGLTDGADIDIAARVLRAVLMARKAQWLHATADIEVVAALLHQTPGRRLAPAELWDLSSLFDWAGHGLIDLDAAGSFFSAITRLPRKDAVSALRAIAKPLPRRMKTAIRQNQHDIAHRVFWVVALMSRTLLSSVAGVPSRVRETS